MLRLYEGRFLLLLIKGTFFCIRHAKVKINYALPDPKRRSTATSLRLFGRCLLIMRYLKPRDVAVLRLYIYVYYLTSTATSADMPGVILAS